MGTPSRRGSLAHNSDIGPEDALGGARTIGGVRSPGRLAFMCQAGLPQSSLPALDQVKTGVHVVAAWPRPASCRERRSSATCHFFVCVAWNKYNSSTLAMLQPRAAPMQGS